MTYVHPNNNPGGIEYNTTLFMFVKSWFMPVEAGATMNDTWLIVPALRSAGLAAGTDIYSPININLENVALMIVTAEGKVLKASRVPTGKLLPAEEFKAVQKDAFNIPEWERTTNQAWPYQEMFNGKKIRERYQEKFGTDQSAFGAILSDTSISYNKARAAVMARPCNCGKPSYSG